MTPRPTVEVGPWPARPGLQLTLATIGFGVSFWAWAPTAEGTYGIGFALLALTLLFTLGPVRKAATRS